MQCSHLSSNCPHGILVHYHCSLFAFFFHIVLQRCQISVVHLGHHHEQKLAGLRLDCPVLSTPIFLEVFVFDEETVKTGAVVAKKQAFDCVSWSVSRKIVRREVELPQQLGFISATQC